jgi:hypothetical protein
VEQHLRRPPYSPKLFQTGLAVTVGVRNLDDRHSAWLIGAGYMIVNEAGYMIVDELALTPAGCGVTRIPASLART